jgi:hypothetical protein
VTSPSPLALGTPFSLAEPSVLHTARGDRLALGVNFRPSTSALGAVSGIVHGPAGSMGELTLVSDTVLRIAPFVGVIQGTHNARQGQYVVPNEQQRDLAIVAKDASLQRRSLLVLRVADSDEAGVAASPTTNGAWLERLDGTLAASNPALPALPANAVALGELTVPSVASGQPVTLTPYNPRTGARHGILPVYNDASTVPGHGSAPGSYVGEYRDHPTRGLERWDGAAWQPFGLGGDTGWQVLAATPPIVNSAGGARYRVKNGYCSFQIHQVYPAGGTWAVGWVICTFPVGARPVWDHWWDLLGYNGTGINTPDFRAEVRLDAPTGRLLISRGIQTTANGGFVLSGGFHVGA